MSYYPSLILQLLPQNRRIIIEIQFEKNDVLLRRIKAQLK